MRIVECANPKCRHMFRDESETCGVCPRCGAENDWADEDYEARNMQG